MGNVRRFALTACLTVLGIVGASNAAYAHLIGFGWKDNGNGTVTMFGEHWHGDLSSPYSDNFGVTIDGTLFQWTGVVNNVAFNTSGFLTGWAADSGNFASNGNSHTNDWLFTNPLVVSNGTHTLFTGTACCVDTMTAPGQFTLTGITSVPEGTETGNAPPVPEPATLALFGIGAAGAVIRRRWFGASA